MLSRFTATAMNLLDGLLIEVPCLRCNYGMGGKLLRYEDLIGNENKQPWSRKPESSLRRRTS